MLANTNNVLIRFVNVNGFGNNVYLDNIKIANGVSSPTNLSANPISSSQINLSWTDNSSNELGYLIERSAVAPIFPNPATFVQVGQVGANVTTFNDIGLAANTTYWYRISAIQQNGIATHYNGQCIVSATTSVGSTTNLLFEDFNASCGTLPAGWTSNLIAGNIAFDFWRVNDDPIGSALLNYGKLGSPASGCFAIFDSDKHSAGGGAENVALESPTIDATGISTVILQFNHLFISDFSAQGLVEVFDGTSWNTVLTYQFGTQGTIGLSGANSTPVPVSVDISAFVANKNTGRVRFRWFGNYGFAWAIDDVAVVGTLGAPINLTATLATENQVNLAWIDTTEGEDGFNIERSETSATAGFTLISTAPLATGAGNTTTYADNTAVAGTKYWYRVQAYKGTSVSSFSNVAQVTTLLNPTALTATALSTSSIRLDWTENSVNEANVIVERSLNPNTGFVTIATLPANANTLTDNNLLENTTYFYRVRAVKNTFSSANSNVANATTLLNAVSNLVANAIGQREIHLQWNDNSTNELGYVIERSLLAMSGFSILVSLPPNSASYTDIGLNTDTQYFYRVYAVSSNASPAVYSNVANALTFPATPTNLIATALSFSSIQINWQDNATTETEYKVERANALDGNFREIATLGANQTTYTDVNLASNTRYFYRVITTRGQASSTYSNVTNAVTLDDPAPLAPILKGQAGSQSVLLTWEAQGNEANIAYYEIYMLGTNIPQRLVGTTGEKRFLVTGLTNAVTYIFRVIAVSRSGASSPFSNSVTLRPSIILGTQDIEKEIVFNVYPNPNSGEFKVQFQGNSQSRVLSIQMINMAGQVVYQKQINALGAYEESINLSNLTSGLYLIHIQTNQGEWRKQVSVVK
jgi:titin